MRALVPLRGLVAAVGLACLTAPNAARAQLAGGATGSANGSAGAPIPGRFLAAAPADTFSLRVDAGATARLLRGEGVAQATTALSLGAEPEIGGFYGVAEFGAGARFAGGHAYSGGLSALYQKPFDWLRLGGGLGLGYHTFEVGPSAWGYELEGFLQVTAELDPFGSDLTAIPYVSLSGRAGGLFAGLASDAFFPPAYAAGAAIGVRIDP